MEIITQITFSNPSLFHPFYRVIAHFVVVDLVRLPWVIFLSHGFLLLFYKQIIRKILPIK